MQLLYSAAAGVGLRVPFGPRGKGESEAGTTLFDPGERARADAYVVFAKSFYYYFFIEFGYIDGANKFCRNQEKRRRRLMPEVWNTRGRSAAEAIKQSAEASANEIHRMSNE